jgi:hypothetical protein
MIAQEKIMMVTRKIENTYVFNQKFGQIIINAERGNISLQSWERDEVKVLLQIVVKNADMKQAQKEMTYIQCNIHKSRGNIFINNKLVLPSQKIELSSIISAKYEIFMPKNSNILLQNKFGLVEVSNASGKISTSLQYCDILFQSFKGSIDLNLIVGDLTCLQSDVRGDITTKHSNITIRNVTGKMDMNTSYGKINLNYGENPAEIVLNSYATDILLNNRRCNIFEIKLNGDLCPLSIEKDCYVPDEKYLKSTYVSEKSAWLLEYTPPLKTARLKIQAKFGTLNML